MLVLAFWLSPIDCTQMLVCVCVCFTCRTSGIVLDLRQHSLSSTLRSKRSSTSSGSEYRSDFTSHTFCVRPDILLHKPNCFIQCGVLWFSGFGTNGQRAGQRDGQTGHSGRDREPAKANVEVCEYTYIYKKLACLTVIISICPLNHWFCQHNQSQQKCQRSIQSSRKITDLSQHIENELSCLVAIPVVQQVWLCLTFLKWVKRIWKFGVQKF